jgi:hypothetical protein
MPSLVKHSTPIFTHTHIQFQSSVYRLCFSFESIVCLNLVAYIAIYHNFQNHNLVQLLFARRLSTIKMSAASNSFYIAAPVVRLSDDDDENQNAGRGGYN